MAHCHTDLHDHTAKLPFELLERIFAYLPDVISGSMPQWTHRDGIKMFTLARWMDDDLLTCNQAIRRVADLAGVAHQDACADWLPVTLVCRRWRAVALAQFGRTIPIPAHSGSLAVDSVLSGFAPLHTSLHIDEKRHYRDPATWKLYGSLLKSNLSRLRRIYISLASPVSTDEYTEVCAAHHTLLNKCNATQIQELYAVGANLAYYTFGSVVMARYGTPRRLVIPSTCFSSLKRIFLRRCVLADRSALCACRQLVSLVLDSCQDMWPDTADMLDTLCTLPYLRELHISGKTWPRDIAFDRDRKAIDLTCLTSVRLTGTIDQLVPFLSAVILHHSASLLLSCHILPWSWGGQSVESDAHPLAKVLSNHFACSKGRGDTFSRVAMDLSETEQNIVCTEPTTSSSAGLIPTTTFALSLRRDWLSLRESGYNTAQEAFAAVYRALPIEDREDGASDIRAGISSRPGLRIHNADTPLNRGVRWWPFVARIRGLQQLTLSSETALPIARQLALSDTETLPHLRNIDIDVGSIKSDDIPLIGEALDATAGARRAACPVAVGRFNTRR